MSYSEALDWFQYRQHVGSLNPGMRVDRVLSLIAHIFGSAYLKLKSGEKFKPSDFTLWPDASQVQDEDIEGTPEAVLAFLTGLKQPEDS